MIVRNIHYVAGNLGDAEVRVLKGQLNLDGQLLILDLGKKSANRELFKLRNKNAPVFIGETATGRGFRGEFRKFIRSGEIEFNGGFESRDGILINVYGDPIRSLGYQRLAKAISSFTRKGVGYRVAVYQDEDERPAREELGLR
jgi:hypothetical protein